MGFILQNEKTAAMLHMISTCFIKYFPKAGQIFFKKNIVKEWSCLQMQTENNEGHMKNPAEFALWTSFLEALSAVWSF